MRIIRVIALLFLVCDFAPKAEAHARLERSESKVGSSLKSSPRVVKLWFSEPLRGASSWIRVEGANEKKVDKKNSCVDRQDKTLMTVSLKHLSPGKYTVFWKALSFDAHETRAHFKFTVEPTK